MYTELKSLLNIEVEELDNFLQEGWFRMQQSIFTTDKELFGNLLYDTIWLRVRLSDFQQDKKYIVLNKKNSQFKTEIKKAVITSKHEALFSRYKESKSFEKSPSLQWLLLGDKSYNVYNTYMLDVYDRNQMIGTGFFDLGKNSAAGICSIYDPDYKTYGLGKYMIYEKMLYCKSNKFRYFYPGYFVPGYPPFDYKLAIGKPALEYFDSYKREWLSISALSLSDYIPAFIC